MSLGKQFIKLRKSVEKRIHRMKRTYKYIKDNRILHDPVETPLGFRLIGNQAMEQGFFEPEETKLVKKILQQVDIFINVGANVGYYCCIALQESMHTVAFEPIENNLRYLYRNIRANNWEDNIEIFPIALSDKTGIIEIFGGGTGASLVKGWAGTPDYNVTSVPTSTIDKVLGSRFHGKKSFILVDIEGAEKLMLEGASSYLCAVPKPIWMVEISTSEHQPKGITVNPDLLSTFQIFWDNGYEAWAVSENIRMINPDEVERIAKGGPNTLQTINFLFIEKDKEMKYLRLNTEND